MLLFSFLVSPISVFADGDKFCHFYYETVTNDDVPVNEGVMDEASNSPGGEAIFYYEISSYVHGDNGYELKTIAQLDCEDSPDDKESFKKIMLKECETVHMGGISVPMSEDLDFSKACG